MNINTKTALRGKNRNNFGLEQLFDVEARPVIINNVEGQKSKPGCNSYVYELTHLPDDKKYIGYHKNGDTLYFSSTTNKKLKDILASGKPNIIDYKILYWGSVKECQQREYELLTAVDAAKNPDYYNKWNGSPGVKELNLELVNELTIEANDMRQRKFIRESKYRFLNRHSNVVEFTITELMSLDKLQIRELEIDIPNLKKIIDRIQQWMSVYDMPVILKNITIDGVFYEYLLISGNHTRTAYWETRNGNYGHTADTKMKCVVITEEVHRLLQESEIYLLANNFNAEYNVGKPFSVADGVQECLKHHKNGHSWETLAMKKRLMLLGLKSTQTKTVFNHVHDTLQKETWKKKYNRMVYDYTATHKSAVKDVVSKYKKDDNTFVLASSSGNPHFYRWMEKYIQHQLLRISIGKDVQQKVKIVVYHTNTRSKDHWVGLWAQLTRPQNLPNTYGETVLTDIDLEKIKDVVKYPEFSYHEMPMWTNKIQKGQKKS